MTAQNPLPVPPQVGTGERGSVLVIALMMLVIFTLLGATFLTMAGTEGNISTNHRGDVQALFVAESGAQLAYQSLAANNFQGFTHQADGTPEPTPTMVPMVFPGDLIFDSAGDNGLNDERDDGWVVWEWSPGDPTSSLTNTGMEESIRFAIRPASTDVTDPQFVIEVEGSVGRFHERLQIMGYTEPAFSYAVFSDGSLTEFTRGEDQLISGKIHANGDIFFRPSATRTLTIDSVSLTATGSMVRTTDAFGRDLFAGNTVRIKDRNGNWVDMAAGAPGVAMDSQNPDWTNDNPSDAIDGALELWGGVIRDGSLGAVQIDPPPVETVEPGGWYAQRAQLLIASGDVQADASGTDISGALGGAVTERTFWNPALGEYVTVQEIDMSLLNSSGYFPANGLLYSDVPLRLVNASELAGDLTIVSAHSIYTKGDFNFVNRRPAAIISKGRIWHLSNAWSDDETYTRGSTASRQATDGITTVNAALVDGQPVRNTAQWADLDGDGSPDDPGAGDSSPDADHLLETWGGGRTLKKYGSIVHLQNADMAGDVYNATRAPDEVSWLLYGAYAPPSRDYGYDAALSGAAGQPPFTPLTGRIFLWQQVGAF